MRINCLYPKLRVFCCATMVSLILHICWVACQVMIIFSIAHFSFLIKKLNVLSHVALTQGAAVWHVRDRQFATLPSFFVQHGALFTRFDLSHKLCALRHFLLDCCCCGLVWKLPDELETKVTFDGEQTNSVACYTFSLCSFHKIATQYASFLCSPS